MLYCPKWYERKRKEEKERKEPPLLQANSKFAVMVINQEKNQLARVAILPAKPFMFTGRISDIMSHGIGPIPNEKKTTIAYNDSTELRHK
jgi:hypothetical protein